MIMSEEGHVHTIDIIVGLIAAAVLAFVALTCG